ncbi:MAG: hypothetical protein EON51_18025, partial [Acinetobacter sp.]
MKKIFTLSLLLLQFTIAAHAQLGKLIGGGKAGKKTGNFATVWESEFSNKASRLAMTNENGTFILGTDDNSATVLNTEGKEIWSGDYKKITTNKTNSSEFQYYIHDKNGGYLF